MLIDDWWDGFGADDEGFGTSFGKKAHDVALLFGKVVGVVLVVAVVVVSLAYGIWRELAVFAFLMGQ